MDWRTATLLAIDVETTGFTQSARIVELGSFLCSGGELDKGIRLGALVDPGIRIPADATAIHGITDRDVAGKPCIEDIQENFLVRVRDADAIVGYNFTFDARMIAREITDWTKTTRGKPVLDALKLVNICGRFPIGKGKRKLGYVAKRLEIPRRGQAHRASSDAELSVRILYALGSVLPEDLNAAARMIAPRG